MVQIIFISFRSIDFFILLLKTFEDFFLILKNNNFHKIFRLL